MHKILKQTSFMVLTVFFFTVAFGGTGLAEETHKKLGSLEIFSKFSGMGIYLDNEYKGEAPLIIYEFQPGTHFLRVVSAEATIYQDVINVKEGEVNTVLITKEMLEGGINTKMNISFEAFNFNNLKGFKSEKEFIPVFMTIGTIYRASVIFGDLNFYLLTSPYSLALSVLEGVIIGFIPDLLLNNYLYANNQVGWVKSKDAEIIAYKRRSESRSDMVAIIEDAKIYQQPNEEEAVGEIAKDNFRKIISYKEINGTLWYKIKIKDSPILTPDKELPAYKGWVKASSTSSREANIGEIVHIIQNNTFLFNSPYLPIQPVDILNKNVECRILYTKDFSGYSNRWLNDRWHRVTTQI